MFCKEAQDLFYRLFTLFLIEIAVLSIGSTEKSGRPVWRFHLCGNILRSSSVYRIEESGSTNEEWANAYILWDFPNY